MAQVDHGDVIVTERSSVVVSDESKTSTTDVEEQSQLSDGDVVLKCFSPLLSSMKLFGLYFTQAPRRIHGASTSASGTTDSQVPRNWNGGRVYAVVILVVAWHPRRFHVWNHGLTGPRKVEQRTHLRCGHPGGGLASMTLPPLEPRTHRSQESGTEDASTLWSSWWWSG